MCPIGTVSEWLHRAAARLGVKPVGVPDKLDRVLSLLKYPLLVVILFFTYRAAELLFRGYCPAYALVSRHGEDITFWAYVVAGGIIVGSLFVAIPPFPSPVADGFARWRRC